MLGLCLAPSPPAGVEPTARGAGHKERDRPVLPPSRSEGSPSMITKLLPLVATAALLAPISTAQTTLKADRIITGVSSVTWVGSPPTDDRVFVTEQTTYDIEIFSAGGSPIGKFPRPDRHGFRFGRAGAALDGLRSQLRHQRLLLRLLHLRGQRLAHRALHRVGQPERRGRVQRAHDHRTDSTAVEPQRRQHPVRSGRLPLLRMG